ncbi:hypothetical protein O6V14_04660 [Sphingomonas faeni]|uniref:hypothetical protein n=1 Tax=Sphingomonas faeni TaxID=185950 RepID=UPI0033590DC1
MFGYDFTMVSRYDGTARKEKAIEVFDARTGATVSICRRAYDESMSAWIERALAAAMIEMAA